MYIKTQMHAHSGKINIHIHIFRGNKYIWTLSGKIYIHTHTFRKNIYTYALIQDKKKIYTFRIKNIYIHIHSYSGNIYINTHTDSGKNRYI